MSRPRRILPVIVVSQFAGTSLWFAGNAVVGSLVRELRLDPAMVSSLTSAVQLGFISGTLVFAFAALTDRYPARMLFLVCALLGASATAAIALFANSAAWLLGLRFVTGFFLAGIYPVGMKIAASWFGKDLGKALGFLVGALVLGTAFPHGVRAIGEGLDWRQVLWSVSALAAFGGVLLYVTVPEGPFTKRGARFDAGILWRMFRYSGFRAAAFGYFGHMWELYALWTFVPWIVARSQAAISWHIGISTASFLVIGIGALGCVFGGLQSQRIGSGKVAVLNLGVSGVCCLLSPLLLLAPGAFSLLLLLVWGWTVVGDSAQFSSLAAVGAPAEYVGSALTLMNCIGFAITILSIELLGWATQSNWAAYCLLLLAPGPALGLVAMRKLLQPQEGTT